MLRLLLVVLSLLGPAAAAPRAQGGLAQRSPQSHVFLIVLENHSYQQVIGSHDAPYTNGLARRGALLTNYFAVSHPSLPNYLALLGGSTFGIRSDCTDCAARGQSLATQLNAAGVSWRAYMEGMPAPCYAGADVGLYAKRHDPFLYFPAITQSQALCDEVVPGTWLDGDLRRGSLASFSWISPDLCHDAHDCSLGTADRYLSKLVPKLLGKVGPAGFLALTFDEGTSDAGLGGRGGGQAATILVGPRVRAGARVPTGANHYSLLRLLERSFGLPYLRHAARASDLRGVFRAGPP